MDLDLDMSVGTWRGGVMGRGKVLLLLLLIHTAAGNWIGLCGWKLGWDSVGRTETAFRGYFVLWSIVAVGNIMRAARLLSSLLFLRRRAVRCNST